MGRLVAPARMPGLDDEYRATRLCRVLASRLAVPPTTDAAVEGRCHAALDRANRAAAGQDMAGRAVELLAAARDVLGDERVELLRRSVEAEGLPREPRRRAQYVSASQRGHGSP